MQPVHYLLHGGYSRPEVCPFQTRSDGDIPLPVLSANLGLRWTLDNCSQGTESRGFSSATGEQSITHGLKGNPIAVRKSHPNNVRTVVADYRSCRRLTFHDCRSVYGKFFWRESCTGSHAGINLKCNCRTTDGVLKSIEHIHHPLYFANGIG